MRNLVWKGVIDEINAVGLVELAEAIDEHERGDEHLKRGEAEAAIREYEDAVKTAEKWVRFRLDRCFKGLVIYEPEVGKGFRYPFKGNDGRVAEVEVKGVPKDVMKLPGITREWAIKVLDFLWQRYMNDSGVTISRAHSVFTARFSENAWPVVLVGAPASIPPAVAEALAGTP
jgi:hypothetical protein